MKKIEFKGALGETLAARLDEPVGKIKAYAIFAHCFTCGMNIAAASRIAKSLSDMGIAVLRFDFTGLGESEGNFADTNFTTNVQDIIKAAEYMRQNLKAPSILIGHSLGGAAVLEAGDDIPEIKAVVTIGAPADTAHIAHHFSEHEVEIKAKGAAQVNLAGRPFTIQEQFLTDVRSQNLKKSIGELDRALLVMHAPLDETVGIDNAAKIFLAAKHPKSFVTLNNADHLLTKKQDAKYAASIISSWVAPYIPGYNDVDKKEKTAVVIDNTTVVKSINTSKFQQEIYMGKHKILADEPKAHGGENTGGSPYDLLCASLGACKSMTLRMYADHKKIPLEGVKVYVSHDKVHIDDCKSFEKSNSKLDKFICEIVIIGKNLTEDNRQRLLEIADKCPVHKTLSSQAHIETK
ncbi:MAG: putative OsmC-like protein/alpha/beta superfamily hydrolase [Alphaproteobacteria bacterium]|jgi:uncharacterized OsmC-like protein/alpha/beta superfamily hydrolase